MNKLKRRLGQWRELDSWERGLLIRLVFLLPLTWLVLRLIGFNRTRRIAQFKLGSLPVAVGPAAQAYAQRCAQLVAIAARHGFYKANCLHRALTLCWLLRRRNLRARIRIGVQSGTIPFRAHAWVELNGVALDETAPIYRAFDRLTAGPETTGFA